MIGAMIAKKKIQSAVDSLSLKDLDTFIAKWAEDAIFIFPSPAGPGIPKSNYMIEGREAIKEWYQRFLAEWEITTFFIKNICVERLCPIAIYSNFVTVEWDLTIIGKGRKRGDDTSGVTTITIENGKASEVRVYECQDDPIWRILGPR